MTLGEMRALLAKIAAYDGRAVDRVVIEEWHAIAGGLDYELGVVAVRYWYTFNAGYMQPHHLAVAAAAVSGRDKPDTVTAQRLEGRPVPHIEATRVLAPMLSTGLELERGEEGE